jgi:hypothetical protein
MLGSGETPSDTNPGTYVCTRCTNRVYSFAVKQPPCTVCGNSEWRRSGYGPARPTLGVLAHRSEDASSPPRAA